MKLKAMTNPEVHASFQRVTHTERKITALVLEHINEVDSRKMFLDYAYPSLYAYLVAEMKYSESCAYRRITAARLVKNNSQLAEKVQSGSLNLTQLSDLSIGLNKAGVELKEEQTKELIQELENKGQFQSQHIIAVALNLPVKHVTKVTPQRDGSVRFEMTFTREQFEELKASKDSLSHVVFDGNWADVIATLASKHNQAKRGKVRNQQESINPSPQNSESQIQNTFPVQLPQSLSAKQAQRVKTPRKYISIKVRRELLQKAHYQCQYHGENGKRCQSTYQLQGDHIVPLAKSGADHPLNMRILCSVHNQAEARRWGLHRPSLFLN